MVQAQLVVNCDGSGCALTNGNLCRLQCMICGDSIAGNNISDGCVQTGLDGCSRSVINSRIEASSGNNVENTAENRNDDDDCDGTLTKGNRDDSIIGRNSRRINCCSDKSAETRYEFSGILINKQFEASSDKNAGNCDGLNEGGNVRTLIDRDLHLAADGCNTTSKVPGPCSKGISFSSARSCCIFDAIDGNIIRWRVVVKAQGRSKPLAVERERFRLTRGAPVSLDTCKEYFPSFPRLVV